MNEQKASEAKTNFSYSVPWYENFPIVCWTIGGVSLLCLAVHWGIKTYLAREMAESMLNFMLKELGLAGLVALILNLSIEWVNRRRHLLHQDALLERLNVKHEQTSERLLADVNKQLFKTIYERNIDPSVFQQVEEHLLRAKIMRKEFNVSFKIESFIDENGKSMGQYVKLMLTNSYRVFNLTDKPIHIDVAKAIVDVTPEFKDYCYFSCVRVGDEEIDRDGLMQSGYVKDVPNRNLIILEVEREIPANDSLLVTLEYTKLAPKDYSEIVISTIPMDNLTIEVVDQLERFTVEAISLHPEGETLTTPRDQRYLRRWKIDHAILPGQGIVLMWHPCDANLQQSFSAG